MYDLIIRNGYIIDGSGNPGFHADLAVKDGKIAEISRPILTPAKKEIDAKIEDIIEFSEIRQFIDTPVKRYSS